jgi:hypothetical protein
MTYNGRRGPNVSEYIAQLNAIPSAQELQSSDDFNLDDDLAMFTNTQFFDFDLGQDADLQPSSFDGRGQTVAPETMEIKPMDFHLQGTFHQAPSSIYSSLCPFPPPRTLAIDVVIATSGLDSSRRPRCSISWDARRILDNQSQSSPPKPSGPMSVDTCRSCQIRVQQCRTQRSG